MARSWITNSYNPAAYDNNIEFSSIESCKGNQALDYKLICSSIISWSSHYQRNVTSRGRHLNRWTNRFLSNITELSEHEIEHDSAI